MPPLAIGFGAPRGVGDPRNFGPPSHTRMLAYAQRAEELGFDSVWFPDHFYFERPPGVFTPYPEAWTTMTATLATTKRVRVGSMVLAAGFRHPALLAHMASALQELSGGRLLLGLGAGNQIAEHTAFGLGFDRRVGRFEEYLDILTRLLKGETVTLHGKHYQLENASLLRPTPQVPIVVAAGGDRMTRLTAKYANGWNAAGAGGLDGELFRQKLAALRAAVEAEGRDPDQFEITYSATVMVAADQAQADQYVDLLASIPPTIAPSEVRERFVVGTPDQVATILRRPIEWGANHLICAIGAQPFTIWSDEMVDLFAKEVMPRVRAGR